MRKPNTLWVSRPLVVALAGLVLRSAPVYATNPANLKQFAQQELAQSIIRANVHKVYFSDLIDSSGNSSLLGRHLAALLSTFVAEKAKTLTVISRWETRKYLANNGWSEHDLYSPGILAKFMSEFQPDTIIGGTVTVDQELVFIDLVARNPSGNELFRGHHEQSLDSVLQADVDSTETGIMYFFPGLDGVTVPKCAACPIPAIPSALRGTRVKAKVVLSVVVAAEGKAVDIRVVKKVEPALERAAIESIQKWRFTPSHDPDGRPVPVRVPIEITFRNF